MSWSPVSEKEAQAHALYGIGGWLAVFFVLLVLAVLASFGAANNAAADAGLTLSELLSIEHPAVSFIKVGLFWQSTSSALMAILILTKAAQFRWVSTWLLLAGFPVMLALSSVYVYEGMGQDLVRAFAQWAMSCAIWLPYLHRSKRVRVTFEHQVQTALRAPPAPGPQEPVRHPDVEAHVQPSARKEPTLRSFDGSPAEAVRGERGAKAGQQDELDMPHERIPQATSREEVPMTRDVEVRDDPTMRRWVDSEAGRSAQASGTGPATSPVQGDLAREREVRSNVGNASPTQKPATSESAEHDEALWAQALQEVEGALRRPGLWARSFAQAKGNEAAAKAAYLEARVEELVRARAERLTNLTPEQRTHALLPKGACPNCEHVQLMTSEECPNCKAEFGEHSSWQLTPTFRDGVL